MKLCGTCKPLVDEAYPKKKLVPTDSMTKDKCDRCGRKGFVTDYEHQQRSSCN